MKKVSLILSAVVMTAMIVTSCGGSTTNESTTINKESSNEITIGKQTSNAEDINGNNESNTKRNSSDFKLFISYFLGKTFSDKNFDSLVYSSSPEFLELIDVKNVGFGRFCNQGIYCNLYVNNDNFGYNFYKGYFGEIQPDIFRIKYFSNKAPEGGFCEEATSPDGIYYSQVSELPEDYDMENNKAVPAPTKYKNLKKMKVEIQYKNWIIKSLYFIEYKTKWYLLYINDCDCSA
jgi:hypothetical protein